MGEDVTHCIDEQSDLKEYINNGVLDYIMDLKKKRDRAPYRTFDPSCRPGQQGAGHGNPGCPDVFDQSGIRL